MFSLPLDYFLLSLFACCGVIQAAAAYSRLYGLLFFPTILAGYLIGGALLVGAFTWFILSGNAAIPGDLGGVEGAEQFALFFGAAALSPVVSAVLSSLTQLRSRGEVQAGPGMKALRQATLLQVLMAKVRKVERHGRS